MLLYSLQNVISGFGLEMEDAEAVPAVRQQDTGHPEFGSLTAGVDVTTGPLASGLASGVGMAIGLEAVFRPDGQQLSFPIRKSM